MSESPQNPIDPASLLSRSLDQPLPTNDQGRLRDALSRSESLCELRDHLVRVHVLVRAFGCETIEGEWKRFLASLEGRIADATVLARSEDEALRTAAALVDKWSRNLTDVEFHRFTDSVLAGIADVSQAGDEVMTALQSLLARWRPLPSDLDFDRLFESVFMQITSEQGRGSGTGESREIDRLLARWAVHYPAVDFDRFPERVGVLIQPFDYPTRNWTRVFLLDRNLACSCGCGRLRGYGPILVAA